MYHPRLGRWLQRDPLGYVDGMSWYEYVKSSPLRATDPTGQSLSGLIGVIELILDQMCWRQSELAGRCEQSDNNARSLTPIMGRSSNNGTRRIANPDDRNQHQ